ncbi:MAG: TetR/AcrR family transcriptional regulator [Gammaproteobacteria bacterium]|nr:TetR/AcrR family transcriptional regulator [Gammaproteobacteria bacterium]MBT8076040.1 TetR/AcrR family transcriptional regulator [Gammaproteobacteria bacterium]MBT8329159.1 TetR/AcrR family transcriptional regulator [Desulfofustis sp.]NNK97746.1 TetR/AcrR family transcriptional regulator [Xanthomonadales bacterium]
MNLKTQASEETKQNIIQTAISILGTEGYPALTVGKLSKQAGVSKGALYHHFDSLEAVRLSALEALIDRLVTIKDPGQFGTLSDYLADLGEDFFDDLKHEATLAKALFAFLAQGMFDEQAALQLHHMMASSMEQCSTAFKHFIPDLPEDKQGALPMILDSYFIGVFSKWFLDFDRAQCCPNWEVLSEMILLYVDTQKEAGQ